VTTTTHQTFYDPGRVGPAVGFVFLFTAVAAQAALIAMEFD